jgi:hypothetical protein
MGWHDVTHKGLRATAIALLLAAGCTGARTAGQIPATTPPSVPAHATDVHGRSVSGVVTDTTGRPVAGASVVVSVALNGGEQAVRAFGAFATVGFYCLLGCSAPHEEGFSARDGSFELSLPGPNKEHDDYNLTAAVARGPARVATSVVVPWRHGSSHASVTVAGGSPRVRSVGNRRFVVPPSLPLRYGAHDFEASLQSETGDPPVANGHSLTVTNGYDARVVEDQRLLLTTAQSGHQDGHDALFSSSLEVRGNKVPASRGSACVVTGGRGQSIRQPTCGLTDGALDSSWQPTDDPRCANGPCKGHVQRDHRDVTVKLRRPLRAALLVVRGCLSCTVSISPDGRHFSQVATQPFGSADDVLVKSLPGTRVAAVRVETDTGGFFTSLREVSVFRQAERLH